MNKKHKILIIEDDVSIYQSIEYFLNSKHILADHAIDGNTAEKKLLISGYDLIILDLNLPDICGIDLCKSIRAQHQHLPVLILSANSGDLNRIIGLEAGANDYLEKPFNILELYVRIKNLLKFIPQKPLKEYGKVIFSDFTFNCRKMTLMCKNQKIELTKVEARILNLLLLKHGQIVSKHDISNVIGISDQTTSRSLSVLMSRLRNKIGDKRATIIQTIRGYGFIFVIPIFWDASYSG
ncbi:response regulator transcription factor [Facilibium subflavum]|uniref:response regulator transcription factor n=1 Tax=Facilibium subflavum TaxID=2219058 RepID=UPI000E65C29C|nr:response regulator transcription factor [Facilibium subflavum]